MEYWQYDWEIPPEKYTDSRFPLSEGWEPFAVVYHQGETHIWFRRKMKG